MLFCIIRAIPYNGTRKPDEFLRRTSMHAFAKQCLYILDANRAPEEYKSEAIEGLQSIC